jgi:hypothetical protein
MTRAEKVLRQLHGGLSSHAPLLGTSRRWLIRFVLPLAPFGAMAKPPFVGGCIFRAAPAVRGVERTRVGAPNRACSARLGADILLWGDSYAQMILQHTARQRCAIYI